MAKNTAKSNTFRTSKEKKDKAKKAKFSFGFFKDPRLKLAFGFFLLLASVFLLTAFISYLFTGKADQSIVTAGGEMELIESGKEARNWLGLYGAIVSHAFIFRWFGVSAFFIPPLLFAWSFKLLFQRSIVRLGAVFTFCLFATLWLCLLLGYMTRLNDAPGEWAFLGGGLGDAMAEVFQSMFGWGTFLILILSLFVFVIYFFNVTALNVLQHRNPKPMGNDAIVEDEVKSSGYTDEGDNWPEIVAKTAEAEPAPDVRPAREPQPGPEPDPETQVEVQVPVEKVSPADKSIDLEVDKTVAPKKQTSADPVFTVEERTETEKLAEQLVDEQGLYDPTLDLSSYKFPPLELLREYEPSKVQVTQEELNQNKDRIVATLINF